MSNLERCLSFMRDGETKREYNDVVLGISTEEELMFKLNLLPEESKNIIVAKWGLDGTNLCSTYKALNAKLGVPNSRELYTMALMDLSRCSWLVRVDESGKVSCIFNDYSSSDFALAVNCSRLRATVCAYRPVTYDGVREKFPKLYDGTVEDLASVINTAVNNLGERESDVIKYRYGLYDGVFKSLEETGRKFDVTCEKVRQIEVKAFRILRHSDIVPKVERPKAPVPVINTEATSLYDLGLHIRTVNCLLRSACCSTIEDLLNLSEEELMNVRNANERAYEECIVAQTKLRQK